jgi:hypothetical protein
MNKKIIFLVVTIASGLLLSCSRDRIADEDLNSYNSPNSYLDSKKQPEQVFEIDSAGTGPIIGNQGTAIWGSIHCLTTSSGDSIDYPFLVKLVELYTPKDMIYYQMPTVSGSTVLQTAGEIRLRAEKDGQNLVLAQPCAFKVSMPNSSPQSNYMNVYYGQESGDQVNWTTDLLSLGVVPTQSGWWDVDTIGYTAYIERLGWINCDRTFSSSATHTITFDSDVDDLTNVAIFAYLPNSQTLIKAQGQVLTGIPEGSDAKVIAIAVDGSGNLFHFYQEIVVSSNSSIMVEMSAISDPDLTAILDAL